MSLRGSHWSVTMNMKNVSKERCDDCINTARQMNWQVDGQLEEGKEGTKHYQLYVRTPQVRLGALKKVFPTAHIEIARNVAALKNYVHKEESKVEELKTVENKFLQWRDVRDRFYKELAQLYDNDEIDVPCTEEGWLMEWDRYISRCIREGLEVDVIGVNPQYRSCIIRYSNAYLRRQYDLLPSVDTSQTDRQEINIPEVNIIKQDANEKNN